MHKYVGQIDYELWGREVESKLEVRPVCVTAVSEMLKYGQSRNLVSAFGTS